MADDFEDEINKLLADVDNPSSEGVDVSSEFEQKSDAPFSMQDFTRCSKLFNAKVESAPKKHSIHEVDLSKRQFDEITKFTEAVPSKVFDDTTYYKTALTGENASAQRLHQVLSKYLTCQDPKDRTVYRQNIISAYWELVRGMAPKMADLNLPMPKRMLVRFGVLLPSLFRPEQKEFFSKIIFENRTGEPVLYEDEWFREIASGRLTNSMTDEKRAPKKATTPEEANSMEQSRLQQLQSKNSGKMQAAENLVNIKENERSVLEQEIRERFEELCEHNTIPGLEPHRAAYSESQQRLFSEITDRLHRLSKNGKEYVRCLKDFEDAKGVYDSVEGKLSESSGSQTHAADTDAVNVEFETVRQMAKMTVGRQGNQFPLFTREFYHCMERGTGTRENVIDILRWVESIDPGAFCRVHKNVPNRIVPYVLLLPTYGDRGFC